jgi:hypothetical protein
MPDLAGLLRTTLLDHMLDLLWGRGNYPEPTGFEVSVCVRVLDKALGEWDLARAALTDHAEAEHSGGTREFVGLFEGTNQLENFVVSLDRLMRYTTALQGKPEIQPFAAMPLPSSAERDRVRDFRNRVIHGDEDLAGGKAGKGLPTATLEPRATDIALHGRQLGSLESLSYAEMTTWLAQIYAFMRAVIAHI